jgi:hypothetical protein
MVILDVATEQVLNALSCDEAKFMYITELSIREQFDSHHNRLLLILIVKIREEINIEVEVA